MPDSNNIISVDLPDLELATTYYARSYIINKYGVTYSNEIMFTKTNISASTSVTDIDGNEYQTVRIGNQLWMCENLRTTRFRNGDIIPTTTPATKDIRFEYMPKYQWAYKGDETLVAKSGRLYTWYTVTDNRGLAPEGWRIPTTKDFDALEKYLIDNGFNYPEHSGDYADFLGKALASTTQWDTNNITGNVGCNPSVNNITNFNAYPVGYKTDNGSFVFDGWTTIFWSSNAQDNSNGYGRQITADDPDLWNCYSPKTFGASVRCVKDITANVNGAPSVQKSNSPQSNNYEKIRTR